MEAAQDAGGGANILLPKKGTAEANNLALLQGRLPEKCEFPKAHCEWYRAVGSAVMLKSV